MSETAQDYSFEPQKGKQNGRNARGFPKLYGIDTKPCIISLPIE